MNKLKWNGDTPDDHEYERVVNPFILIIIVVHLVLVFFLTIFLAVGYF